MEELNIAFLIPHWNEGRGMSMTVDKLSHFLGQEHFRLNSPEGRRVHLKLIYLDDGSLQDNFDYLSELLLGYSKEESCLVRFIENKGYGTTVHKGQILAKESGYHWAVIIDSDLSMGLDELQIMCDEIIKVHENKTITYVKGSRFLSENGLIELVGKRRFATLLGNRISTLLTHHTVTDPTTGYRSIRLSSSIFDAKFPIDDGFSSIVQELYLVVRHGECITEVPYRIRMRDDSKRKSSFTFNYQTISSYLYWCFKIYFFKSIGVLKKNTLSQSD